MENGKQNTVGWHAVDLLMTHEDTKANKALIYWSERKYGEKPPLTVHRGNVHRYLGMISDF